MEENVHWITKKNFGLHHLGYWFLSIILIAGMNLQASPIPPNPPDPLVAGSISADQAICTGSYPSLLIGVAPTGGTTPYSYQWQSSPDNSAFADVTGETSLNFQPGTLTQTTYYRLNQFSSGGTATVTTNTITVNVNPYPATPVISPAGPIDLCYGTSIELSVPPQAGSTYCWYEELWQNEGNAGFSSGGALSVSLAISSSGEPYVAYRDASQGYKGFVRKFDGTNWINVGPAGFSTGLADYPSLAFSLTGEPYVAFKDQSASNKATVMKFDGTNWINVGSAGFSAGSAANLSLVFSVTGDAYLAYSDGADSYKATVVKFDGTSWVNVGSTGFSAGSTSSISLAFSLSGEPYVAYQDKGNSYKATVMKYNGTDWINVGNAGFSTDKAEYTSLAFSQVGEPYIAFSETNNNSKITVMKFDGSSWMNLGVVGFSRGWLGTRALVFYPSGEPYISFRDNDNSGKAAVKKFNGTNWVLEGISGFSAGSVSDPSLAINTSGVLYVAYSDGAYSGKATVMKADPVCISTSNTYMATSSGSYTMRITNTSGCFATAGSNVDVTSYPEFEVKYIFNEDDTICSGVVPEQLEAMAPDGGITPYSVQWQSSMDGTTFSDIAGATGSVYQPDALTATTYYRQMQTSSGGCGSGYTDTVVVRVNPNPLIPDISPAGPHNLCAGTSIELSIPTQTNSTYCWQNNEWKVVGVPDFSGDAVDYTSLALGLNGTPYVAFADDDENGAATVMKYENSNWMVVGEYGFSAGEVFDITIEINSTGVPYVAFSDDEASEKLTVMKYDGTGWVVVGSPGFSDDEADFISLTFWDIEGLIDIPIVAYKDIGNGGGLTVKTFIEGPDFWFTLGDEDFTGDEVWFTSLAFSPSGDIYVAFIDDEFGEVSVASFDWEDEEWFPVGGPNISGESWFTSLAISPDGDPYVAFCDDEENGDGKVTVMGLVGDFWGTIGTDGFSAGAAAFPSLRFSSNGDPYVAYLDVANGFRATVMGFDGSNWVTKGSAGFSKGEAYVTSLAISSTDDFYVAYVDEGNNFGATVMGIDNSCISNTTALTVTESGTYQVTVTNATGCTSASSNQVEVDYYEEFVAGTISADQTICYNTAPVQLDGVAPTGGGSPYTYQWQSSSDGTSFSDISGATSLNYQPGSLTQKTWYRLNQISASDCGTVATDTIIISIFFMPGSVSSTQAICYNTAPAELQGVAPTGGTTPYTYQWQSSTYSLSWADIPGATSMNYQPGALTTTTFFRLKQTSASGSCPALTTTPVTIFVYAEFMAGSISSDQVICYNISPTQLTGVAPTGGNGPYTYQWQSSGDGISFTDITGATGINYQPGALTQTSWYRLKQTSGGNCGTVMTNPVTITVYPAFQAGSIIADQNICYNTIPSELTGTAPTGGISPYSYQWESSANNVTFTPIAGATGINYQPGALMQTTWYRLNQTSASGCGTLSTNEITISVYPEVTAGLISADQSICFNTTPAELTGVAPTGGNTPYSYQWQNSTDGTTFSDIPGATNLDYQPGALSQTTHYRLNQTSAGACGTMSTNVVTIMVYPDFVAGSVSSDQSICFNTVPLQLTGITPTGGTTPYTYQWQSSSDGITFTDITGATGINYQPGTLTQTSWYRLKQTSTGNCGTEMTNPVTITVYPAFQAGSISADQSICYNTMPSQLTGIAPSGGNIPYIYQWESSTDNVTFTPIAGATGINYQPGALMQTTWYRQNQTSASSCGTFTTDAVTITVYPTFQAGSISTDQSVCYNTVPAELIGLAPTGGNTPYTYQWQSSTNGTIFSDIPGATNLNFQPSMLTQTTWYQLIQTSADGCGTLTTNPVTITVYPEFLAGSISANQSICNKTIPAQLTGTAPTGGKMPYTYQWQSSIDGTAFTDIPGANNLNFQAGTMTRTTYYRLEQNSSGGCESITTNTVTITVYPEFMVGSVSSDQDICYNTTPAQFTGTAPTGGNTPYAYQWQSSMDNQAFMDIPGATALDFQPGTLTTTTWYRQKQTSTDGCGISLTNTIRVMVYPDFQVGSISDNQAICYYTVPNQLSGIAPSGGNTPYSYQWQSSMDNITFTDIIGATSLNFQPDQLPQSTWYRLNQISSNDCGTLSTNTVAITVYPEFHVGSVSADQGICYNTVPAQLVGTAPTGGNPPYSYQWQYSTDNLSFADIAGATGINYQPGALVQTTWYRLKQTSAGSCGMMTTDPVKVTVYQTFVVGSISTDQIICYNTTPAQLIGVAPSGGNMPYAYQWQISNDNLAFSDISGAISMNYQPGPLTQTIYYRLKQTSSSGCGTEMTNTVSITVYPEFQVGSISANQNICYNTVPGRLFGVAPTGGSAPYTYKWQSSTDGITFKDVSGAPNLSYQPGALTTTTWFRQLQTSANGCGTRITDTVIIAVLPEFMAGSISADQVIAYNTTPAQLNGIAPAGGILPYTYQWLSSTDNITFSDITGATSINYQPGDLTETIYYKLEQTSYNGCGSVLTNDVTITVNPPVPATVDLENVTVTNGEIICYNATQIITVAGNGTTFTVENGGSATFIAGSKILFLPGTVVLPGGYLHGYITTDNTYCTNPGNQLVVNPILEEIEVGSGDFDFDNIRVKLYPNPTDDLVTLEIASDKSIEKVYVTIYSMLGKVLIRETLTDDYKHQFSLSGNPPGIYMVHLRTDNWSEILKIVKQ